MKKLKTDICAIIETWITENAKIKEQIEDFESITGYKLIRKDRAGRRGGGVAVCFNTESLSTTPVKTRPWGGGSVREERF